MKKNIIKPALLMVLVLLIASVGFAAKDGKAPPVKTDATAIEQERAPKASADPAQGEEINWQVISSGGTEGTSTNYTLKGTVGQTAVGYGSSANYGLSHGFWQEFGGGCCNHDGIRGDVDYNMGINVGDLTYLVCHLFCPPGCPGYPGNCPAPPCMEEANVDASIPPPGVNVGDLAYLVDYLFGVPQGPAPLPCP